MNFFLFFRIGSALRKQLDLDWQKQLDPDPYKVKPALGWLEFFMFFQLVEKLLLTRISTVLLTQLTSSFHCRQLQLLQQQQRVKTTTFSSWAALVATRLVVAAAAVALTWRDLSWVACARRNPCSCQIIRASVQREATGKHLLTKCAILYVGLRIWFLHFF